MIGWRRPLLGTGLALLYFGVVLNGMALPFFPALALSSAALLGYNLVMRPSKDWAPNPPAFVLSLVVLAAISALLVGLGGVMHGWTAPLPPLLGPGAMALGIALSRIAWSSAMATQIDDFLDDATTQLTAMAHQIEPQPQHPPQQSNLPELTAHQTAQLAQLRAGLAALPLDPPERAAELDRLLMPLRGSWADLISHLHRPDLPQEIEAAAHLLLTAEILPQAFGHPDVGGILSNMFLAQPLPRAEAAANRALAMDLDHSEAWRLLPSFEALAERARLADDPPALTALASVLAEREAEDAALYD